MQQFLQIPTKNYKISTFKCAKTDNVRILQLSEFSRIHSNYDVKISYFTVSHYANITIIL